MPTPEVEAVAAEINALEPPMRLRLAADLMEQGRGDMAHPIIARVAAELGAVIAMRALDKRAAGKGRAA